MKKSIMFIIISIVLMLSLKVVEARECQYGIPSPPIYHDGRWAYGQTLKFKTSDNVCLAKNMYVYFSDGGRYAWLNELGLEVYLMEDDQDPNPDDVAKKYIGKYIYDPYDFNYSWDWRVVTEETNNGHLDSNGDQTCELYLKMRYTEAPYTAGYSKDGLFTYTICMD